MVLDGTGVAFDGVVVMVEGVVVMVEGVRVMVDGVAVMVEGVVLMVEGVVVMVEGVRVIGGVAVTDGGMACWGSMARPERQNGIKANLAGKDGAWSLPAACARGSRSQRLLSAAARRRVRFIGISPVMDDAAVLMV